MNLTTLANKNLLLICVWLFVCHHLAASTAQISFDEFSFKDGSEKGRLEALQGQRVQVRGFWYPLPSEGLAHKMGRSSASSQAPSTSQLTELPGQSYEQPPSGNGVLAPSPQLKSCCLQTPSKIEQQLLVFGPSLASLPPQRALTLEGVFYIRPKYNSEGELVQLYVMDEAEEIQLPSTPIPSLFFLIPLAGVIFLISRYFFLNRSSCN